VLFNPKSYTYDFDIEWEKKAEGIFYYTKDYVVPMSGYIPPFYAITSSNNESPVSAIEVKPVFDQHNMERDVKSTLKWVYDKMKIYVQIVKPEVLFETTFAPKEFLLTNAGKPRRLKYTPRTLSESISNIQVMRTAQPIKKTTKAPVKPCDTCKKARKKK
jgi:hypothetical protein